MGTKAATVVTVSNSKEHVEVSASTSTHRAIFVITEGDRFTSDDVLQTEELPAKCLPIAQWKKNKRER